MASMRPGLPSRLDEILAGAAVAQADRSADAPGDGAALADRAVVRVEHHGDRARRRRGGRDGAARRSGSRAAAQLDDVIRKQLGEARSSRSRAAPRSPTASRRHATIARARRALDRAVPQDRQRRPVAARGDRRSIRPASRRRAHTEPMVEDRRTPGCIACSRRSMAIAAPRSAAPPTGASPKIDPNASGALGASTAPTVAPAARAITTFTGRSRRRLGLAIGAIVVVAGGGRRVEADAARRHAPSSSPGQRRGAGRADRRDRDRSEPRRARTARSPASTASRTSSARPPRRGSRCRRIPSSTSTSSSPAISRSTTIAPFAPNETMVIAPQHGAGARRAPRHHDAVGRAGLARRTACSARPRSCATISTRRSGADLVISKPGFEPITREDRSRRRPSDRDHRDAQGRSPRFGIDQRSASRTAGATSRSRARRSARATGARRDPASGRQARRCTSTTRVAKQGSGT